MPHAGSPNQSTLSTVYWTKSTHLKICTTVIAEYSTICNSQQNDDIILIIHSSSKNIGDVKSPPEHRGASERSYFWTPPSFDHILLTRKVQGAISNSSGVIALKKKRRHINPENRRCWKRYRLRYAIAAHVVITKYTLCLKKISLRVGGWVGLAQGCMQWTGWIFSLTSPIIHCTNLNSFAADFLAPSAGFVGGKNLKTGYPPNVRKYGDYHRQRHWGRPVDFSRQRHWNGVDNSRQGQQKS